MSCFKIIKKYWLICFFLLIYLNLNSQKHLATKVLVIGGGTSGVCAGLQAAQLGVPTVIVEETSWLGGMMTSAGVSAFDGNHELPSGLFGIFRDSLYERYGGANKVNTGWISHTLFEPSIGNQILQNMVRKEKNLTVITGYTLESLKKNDDKIISISFKHIQNSKIITIQAEIFIDATELGDILAKANVAFDVGLKKDSIANEKIGVSESQNIIQDLTYCAILKDYGTQQNKTISQPLNYNPAEFDGSCLDYYFNFQRKNPSVSKEKMLSYAALPNHKFLINWPNFGNDTYLNIIDDDYLSRQSKLELAKQTTLRFVYFIQHELGYKNLGLADDEFPTPDLLPFIAYHREGRRVKGLVRFNSNHILDPFNKNTNLYRTGIAVGDYPIDHHHSKCSEIHTDFKFPAIPSFNVPLGVMLTNSAKNLIIAEKAISVSNVVNGATRLQPVVMQIGQTAGCLAALSILNKTYPISISIRTLQENLLDHKLMLMPYLDVKPNHPYFKEIHKIGASGIIRGHGVPYKWANQTWFYPDSTMNCQELLSNISDYMDIKLSYSESDNVTINFIIELFKINNITKPNSLEWLNYVQTQWESSLLKDWNIIRPLKKYEIAVILDKIVNPFQKEIDIFGNLVKE